MPNITNHVKFKAGDKTYQCCSWYGWNGTEECIWFYEINADGIRIGEMLERGKRAIQAAILKGAILL